MGEVAAGAAAAIVGAAVIQLVHLLSSWVSAKQQLERDRQQRREEERRQRHELIRTTTVELAEALRRSEDMELLEQQRGLAEDDRRLLQRKTRENVDEVRRLRSELLLLAPEGSRLAAVVGFDPPEDAPGLERRELLEAARDLIVQKSGS